MEVAEALMEKNGELMMGTVDEVVVEVAEALLGKVEQTVVEMAEVVMEKDGELMMGTEEEDVVEVAVAVEVMDVVLGAVVLVAAKDGQDLDLQFRLPYLYTVERAIFEYQYMQI